MPPLLLFSAQIVSPIPPNSKTWIDRSRKRNFGWLLPGKVVHTLDHKVCLEARLALYYARQYLDVYAMILPYLLGGNGFAKTIPDTRAQRCGA
jgi:hypothetical protein